MPSIYTSRYQQVTRMLQRMREGMATSDELAAMLNVSQRTIYRIISELRADGHRIIGAAGAGYVLREQTSRESRT